MSVTEQELTDFHSFASDKLENGGAESMAELARLWEEWRSYQDSVAALRQSHEDAEAGRVYSADDVFSDARKSIGALK